MSRYKAYPEYKESGVNSLGMIPTHWSTSKLKFVTTCLDGKRVPLNASERGEMQGDIPYWGANSVVGYVRDWLFDDELVLLGEDGAPFFEPNRDVAFHVSGKIWPNNHVHVLMPNKKLFFPKYLTYCLNCVDYYLYITGSTRDKLNQSDMNNITLRMCDLHEQQKIAAFLDYETAKIDALIAKQQRLIEFLKEKRQAVISHTVTKGLNPNAPMKDSGVEWLGEVPAHWEVKCIRYVIDAIGDVDHFMPPSVEKGVPYLMTSDLKDCISEVSLDDCKQVSHSHYIELSKRIKTSKGDIVMARYATIGTLMYVDVDVEMLVSYSCVTLKTNQAKMLGMYLFQYMKSDAFRQGVEHRINTNTQGNVGIKDLQGMKVAVPPSDEQEAIAAFLAAKSLKMDTLIAKAESTTALLKERRTALISAAVTGKIDVRDWQAAA